MVLNEPSFVQECNRWAEEERLYALERGRKTTSMNSSSDATELNFEVHESPRLPPQPSPAYSNLHTTYSSLGSGRSPPPAATDTSLKASDAGLKGAGAIFLTKYGRSSSRSEFSSSKEKLATTSTNSPSRSSFYVSTPGPGAYEIETERSMTSLSSRDGDKPLASFRSSTDRFALSSPANRFTSSDPLHLEPGSKVARDTTHFKQASPNAFKRGNSYGMSQPMGSIVYSDPANKR